jgi:hypothetical protein
MPETVGAAWATGGDTTTDPMLSDATPTRTIARRRRARARKAAEI